MVIGIDPEREAKVSTLRKLVRKGRYLSAGDNLQAVLGKLLAENLRVGIGDEVVLLGQAREGSIAASIIKVKGIYSSGQDEFDRSSIYLPLKTFQEVYGMRGAVHEAVVMAKTLQDVETIKHDVSTSLDKTRKKDQLVTLDWMELMPGLIQSIKVDLGSGLLFYFILVVVVAFSILNTFLMAVFERTREFGVLLAVGTTPGRLTRLLLLESVTMTLVGIIIGILLGCMVTWYFQVHGIAISGTAELMSQFGLPERMYPRLSLLSTVIGAGGVLVITLLTALYPALKVRRLRPVEAMTHVQAV
jgi:ABC-type lipoprotein release transport system permease subunit